MPQLFHVRFALRGLSVDVIRDLAIPEDYTLYEVHLCLQVALGWNDMAPFEFVRKGLTVGIEPSFAGAGITHEGHRYRHADEITLRQLIGQVGHAATYTYDFSRLWGGELRVVAKLDQAADLPSCLAVDGIAPPETLAQKEGFELLLEAAADPSHELHRLALSELGDDFEVDAPEADEITDALHELFGEELAPYSDGDDDADASDDWGWWDPSKYDDKMRLRVLQEEVSEELRGQVAGGTAAERQSSLLDALRGKR